MILTAKRLYACLRAAIPFAAHPDDNRKHLVSVTLAVRDGRFEFQATDGVGLIAAQPLHSWKNIGDDRTIAVLPVDEMTEVARTIKPARVADETIPVEMAINEGGTALSVSIETLDGERDTMCVPTLDVEYPPVWQVIPRLYGTGKDARKDTGLRADFLAFNTENMRRAMQSISMFLAIPEKERGVHGVKIQTPEHPLDPIRIDACYHAAGDVTAVVMPMRTRP